MVKLDAAQVKTKEVLGWTGLHLFHYKDSTCSRKVRTVLALKRLEYTGHHIELSTRENISEYYLGINPRGLVPCLVHDGAVIIESNDIVDYIEAAFPEPRLVDAAAGAAGEAEDRLHMATLGAFGGGFGFGLSPFSLLSPNVLVLGLAAYIAVQVLSNRAGGSDFSNFDDIGSLGSGATLMKIQVALDDDWSKKGNIMDTLDAVSSKYSDLSSRSTLSQLLSDTSLALLRKSGDWNAVSYDGEIFRGGNSRDVEPAFQRVAVRERSKFEQETTDVTRYSGVDSCPTQVVVSLVVALRGKAQAYADKVNSTRQLKDCLQNLAADALTDDGENIMAVELLFTPSEPGMILSERDIVEDYPELLRL